MFRRFWSLGLADRLTVRQQTAIMTGLLCVVTVGAMSFQNGASATSSSRM